MSITNFMNLNLPEVLVDLGPEWATEINTALETVDAHDHSSGKGTKVKVAGMDINAALNFQNNKAYNLFSTQYQAVTSVLTGATNAQSLSVFSGNLYYTNAAGLAVQLTSGGSIVSTPAALQSVETTLVNTNLIIAPSDTFVYLIVDTTSSRTITLPLASGVSSGRIYIVKDASGLSNTNPITVQTSGADLIEGASTFTIDSNRSSTWIIGNGTATWYVS